MDLMFEPIRGGNRGGAADFKWSDVAGDKDRENYLGHSINAPVGRWQKSKDIHWYNRDKDQTADERAEELKRVKEAEAEAMSVALGFKPTVRSDPNAAGESSENGEAHDMQPPHDIQAVLAQERKKREKEERRARKEERRIEKERRRAEKDARKDARSHRHRSRSRDRESRQRTRSGERRRDPEERGRHDSRRYSRSRSPPRRDNNPRRYADRPPRESSPNSIPRSYRSDKDYDRDR